MALQSNTKTTLLGASILAIVPMGKPSVAHGSVDADAYAAIAAMKDDLAAN